jgi:Fe-S cluster assembly scaffold protein SufB
MMVQPLVMQVLQSGTYALKDFLPVESFADAVHIVIASHAQVVLHDDGELLPRVRSITYEIMAYGQLTLYQEHDAPEGFAHTIAYTCTIEREGMLTAYLRFAGGRQAAVTFAVILRGMHASAYVRGVIALAGSEQRALTTVQEHQAPHTSSDLLIHAGVADAARLSYVGTITVHEQAAYTQASQRATILLLGPAARATAVPSLQVSTNDVRCAHGSAIGRLDDAQVRYLASRGVSGEVVKKLLLEGFFAGIVHSIPSHIRALWLTRILAPFFRHV